MAKANVYVTLKPSLLDAQGKVVQGALENLGYDNVESVRMVINAQMGRSEEAS